MIGWWKTINQVLRREPEVWLAYLYGQKFDKLKHLQESKPRYCGVLSRVAVWTYMTLRPVRIGRPARYGHHKFLAYAGTGNQKASLDSTLVSLKELDQSVLAITSSGSLGQRGADKPRFEAVSYGVVAWLKIMLILLVRLLPVYRATSEKHPLLASRHIDVFLHSHKYLVYFEEVLNDVRPEAVIVSNDHSVDNRALIALASRLGIKTVYLQHASVSPLFPALNVDHAFLDGMAALKTYLSCVSNSPAMDDGARCSHVYLSGQKKTIRAQRNNDSSVIGLALNALDDVQEVRCLVSALREEGVKVCVRCHPRLGKQKIDQFNRVAKDECLLISDPRDDSVADFLSRIGGLVAGNSSIHLEAALAGVPSVCYEAGKQNFVDYYGYIAHGVCSNACSVDDVVNFAKSVWEGACTINAEGVRYYSATYGTRWEGREGRLVAESLIRLLDGVSPSEIYGYVRLKGAGD